MKKLTAALLAGIVLSTGCASLNSNRSHMDPASGMAPEDHTMWARPQEVGYAIGQDISGEATNIIILFGLFSIGAEEGLLGILGGFGAGDPLVRTAAGAAVQNAGQGVDGIYITHHETSTLNFLWLFRKRTATVKGRALTLRPLGEVSLERADRFRYLQALGGGDKQLNFPSSMLDILK